MLSGTNKQHGQQMSQLMPQQMPTQMPRHQFRLTRLSTAVLAVMATALASATAAYAEPNVTVSRMLERANSTPASMCFIFSGREHVASHTDNLQQFIELKKGKPGEGTIVNGAPAIDQDLLCVSNLEHGSSYELILKPGLSFVSGTKLKEAVKIPFTISDASAQIKLPYNIILPKNGTNSTFAIQTVNQPGFRLAIYKLSSRSLNQMNLQALLSNELRGWPLQDLLNNNAHQVYEKVFNLTNNTTIDLSGVNPDDLADNGVRPVPYGGPSEMQAHLKAAMEARLLPEMRNKVISTEIALEDFVKESDDGMYLVIAADPRIDYRNGFSYQDLNNPSLPLSAKFMMITDLGLSTYRSPEGILVNVRSLTTAENLSDVKLSLIASNNEILATATTDKDGTARFDESIISGIRALRPTAILAETKDDMYALSLDGQALYLEDNQGALSVNDFETYAYTERGIYREGETVHYTALVRDNQLKGVNLPLTLQIMGKYQNELSKVLLDKSKAGGYEYDFTLPEGTPHGSYHAVLKLGNKVLADTPFTVGAFIPTQVNSRFLNTDEFLTVDQGITLKSQTDFNYGSAASNLNGLFTVTLQPDPKPIPKAANAANNDQLALFHFGPDSRDYGELVTTERFAGLTTDAEGVLSTKVTLKDQNYPQVARISSTVYDTNGQEVTIGKQFKLSFNRPLIGVRRLNHEGADTTGVNAVNSRSQSFALCSYLQDGSTFPQDVKYYLYKEFIDYNYVYERGSWQFVRFKGKNLVTSGSVRVDNQELSKALITADLDDGSYVLELESDKSNTTYAFVKGFASSADAFTPDRIALYANKDEYSSGDTVKLTFDSPFDGYANLAIGNRGIADFRTFKISKGTNEVEFKVTEQFYPQGHALLSIFSPLEPKDSSGRIGSVRAVGLCDINLNLDDHKLKVTAEVPESIKPASTLTVNVKAVPESATPVPANQDAAAAAAPATEGTAVDAAAISDSGRYAKVTLVDNGVLALTGYRAPNPNAVLMQDRAYNVSLYDAYGLLMTDPKQQGQGYGATMEKMMMDAAGGTPALETLPFKTVALASKIVPLDDKGQARVDFDIPQFSGSLKVMAVAWDEERTGASSQDVTIADNAVAVIGLPRFLNVGDTVEGRLNLHNLKAKNPEFKVDIVCSGAIKCAMQSVSTLKPGIREDKYFKITSKEPGVGHIKLKVLNPDFNYDYTYDLAVTYPQLPMLHNYLSFLQPGASTNISLKTDFKDIDAVLVSKSKLPNVNPKAYTSQIDRFGYNSLGDIVASLESKLLYGKELIVPAASDSAAADSADAQSKIAGPVYETTRTYRSEAELNNQIQDLIFRIVARQTNMGNFVSESEYFSVYAADVLMKAAEMGYEVNNTVLDRAQSYLRTISNSFEDSGNGAYVNEILSRQESINQSSLRYALDERKVESPIMLAHLAKALVQIGDKNRAALALDQAINGLLTWQQLSDELSKLAPTDENRNKRYELLQAIAKYNTVSDTDLRHDAFVVIDACLSAGQNDKVIALINKLRCLQETPDYLSDLTMAAMLRANAAVGTSADDDLSSSVLKESDLGALLSSKSVKAADTAAYQIENGKLIVTNKGKTPIFVTTSALGLYNHDNVISNHGLEVNVNYFTRDKKIDPNNYQFALNEEVLMEVNYSQKVSTNSRTLLKVKLPAGFEFVRNAARNDPIFSRIISDDVQLITPEEFTSSDDMVTARYYNYDNNSLFLVLRAAHPGTFKQGEALVQLQSSPQHYGSFTGTAPLKISAPKAPKKPKAAL